MSTVHGSEKELTVFGKFEPLGDGLAWFVFHRMTDYD